MIYLRYHSLWQLRIIQNKERVAYDLNYLQFSKGTSGNKYAERKLATTEGKLVI